MPSNAGAGSVLRDDIEMGTAQTAAQDPARTTRSGMGLPADLANATTAAQQEQIVSTGEGEGGACCFSRFQFSVMHVLTPTLLLFCVCSPVSFNLLLMAASICLPPDSDLPLSSVQRVRHPHESYVAWFQTAMGPSLGLSGLTASNS